MTLTIAASLLSFALFFTLAIYVYHKTKTILRARNIKKISRLRRIKNKQFLSYTETVRHNIFKSSEINWYIKKIIDEEAKLSKQDRGFNNWFAPKYKIDPNFSFEAWLLSDLKDYLACLATIDLDLSTTKAAVISILTNCKMPPENLRRYALGRELKADNLRWKINNTMHYCLAVDSDKDAPKHTPIAYLQYRLYNFAALELIYCGAKLPVTEFDTLTDHNTRWQTAFLTHGLGYYFPMLGRSNEDYFRFKSEQLKKAETQDPKSGDNDPMDAKNRQPGEPEDLSSDPRSIDELIAELNSLPGLDNVKKEIKSLLDTIKIDQFREKNNLEPLGKRAHFVFTGNPGTGKTTVARLIAKIYGKLGLLSKSTFLEVDRSDLVAGYVGQTALKVKDVLNTIKGGVLFIDEAYSLAPSHETDFAHEAISTLLNGIENNRDDLVVIIAGYQEEMKQFVNSNPGLLSRFTIFIDFPDYTPEDLNSIFLHMAHAKQLIIPKESEARIQDYITYIHDSKDKTFANGRAIRTILEQLVTNLNTRLAAIPEDTQIPPETLMTILPTDVDNLTQQDEKFKNRPKPVIGF